MKHEESFLKRRSWMIILFALVLVVSCEQEENPVKQISSNDKEWIKSLGFSIDGLQDLGEFYLVENDVMLRKDRLHEYQPPHSIDLPDDKHGRVKQARMADLVSLENQRNITVFVDNSIPTTGDDNWRAEVPLAIAEINGISNSRIRMQLVAAGPADITIRDDAGALPNLTVAAAEPPVGGNAGFQIRINLDAGGNMVFTTGQKLRNIVHELGHCVGFRHTNWIGLQEPVPAIGIGGTPTAGDNPDPNSVMNGNTAAQSWNGFSIYDIAAYAITYPSMTVNVSGPAKGWNNGLYTWSVSAAGGIAPYTYYWEYGYDGVNYDELMDSGTDFTANLPLDFDLYLRVTGTASDGETAVDYHHTMNLGDRDRP